MSLLFLSVVGIYSALINFAAIKWAKITKHKLPAPNSLPRGISIIVPVRNEVHHISRLLTAIAQQSLTRLAFEVIIVDDHSTDGTLSVLNQQTWPVKISILSLAAINQTEGGMLAGKKHAISQGIKHASGEIIVTTDADCYMEKEWLQSIYDYFAAYDLQMLVGPVVLSGGKGLFEKLQSIEFAVLIGTGAVALDSGSPNMCNGANLAFKKRAFEAVGGYQGNYHIPSGDDEFLLQKIYHRYASQVQFNGSKAAVVYTEPVKALPDFVNQRRRWSSKWKLHKSRGVKILAVGVFSFHLGLVVSLLAALLGYLSFYVFAMGFLVKAVTEYLFIKSLLRHFGKPLHPGHFIILQGIYSIYVLIFGVLSNFGSFEWKGRSYKQ